MATFYNQARLSYSGGTVDSNITVGELVSPLAVTKTAAVDEYSIGSDITFSVNLINSGTTDLNCITLTDNLGAYTFESTVIRPLDYLEGSLRYFVNGVLQNSPDVTSVSPLVIRGLSIPADGIATMLYTARVNSFAPPLEGGSITNTVSVLNGCLSELTASSTVAVSSSPRLTITKSLCPATVTCSDQINYTFLIQNYGNTEATAADVVSVTDIFDPILQNISVTYNGSPWQASGNYTYNTATGLFKTVPGRITVPAATYTQNPTTGEWTVTPGTATLTVSGTL